jgi:hypothetical protein
MAKQILVVLKQSDRLEEIVPYLERIGDPGTKVIFLVGYSDGRDDLIDFSLAIHTGIRPAVLPGRRDQTEIHAARKRWAEQRVLPRCEHLLSRRIKIEVNVYSGPLDKVLKQYIQKKNVNLVMMRPTTSQLSRCLNRLGFVSRLFRPLSVRPVLLLRPERT